jgi:hypothetical protein
VGRAVRAAAGGPMTLVVGDFTTYQRRSFTRCANGRFRCSLCGGRTSDPMGHGADGRCFASRPVCEVRACQRSITGPAAVLFGQAGGATRIAHAHCYLPSQGKGLVWLW